MDGGTDRLAVSVSETTASARRCHCLRPVDIAGNLQKLRPRKLRRPAPGLDVADRLQRIADKASYVRFGLRSAFSVPWLVLVAALP